MLGYSVCVNRGKLRNGFGSSICAYHLNVFTAGSLCHTTCQVGSSGTRTGYVVSFPDSHGCQEVAHLLLYVLTRSDNGQKIEDIVKTTLLEITACPSYTPEIGSNLLPVKILNRRQVHNSFSVFIS